MKATLDPRHKKREQLMRQLFSLAFQENPKTPAELAGVMDKLPQIDQEIQACAPEWPINQINRVDLAVLRLGVWELMEGENPYKVVIDEAVELAKEYGSENSPKFINGVLGAVYERLKNDQ